ncbi:hypothetical protein D1007_45574 [Hordeum vulgare]|nr:hypothetical protein D1007_45574 [Hordeum vulgare]
MCSEPTSLAVLMAKANKYATADSAMRVKVTASNKVVPMPATPKPAGDSRGGENNNKRKANQLDSRSNNKLVASMEGEAPASQAGSQRKRPNRGNPNWLPKQTFEQLFDAPCKIHFGAAFYPHPSTVQLCTTALARGGRAGCPSYTGYSSCAGYAGSADSNCGTGYNYFAGYNTKSGFALPRIMSSRHPVGGRHGDRRRAGCHDGIRDTLSRAHDYCFIKRWDCRSP